MGYVKRDLEKCFRNWTCLREDKRKKYDEKADKSGRRALDIFIDECLAKQERNREMNNDMINSARETMRGFRFLGFIWGKP